MRLMRLFLIVLLLASSSSVATAEEATKTVEVKETKGHGFLWWLISPFRVVFTRRHEKVVETSPTVTTSQITSVPTSAPVSTPIVEALRQTIINLIFVGGTESPKATVKEVPIVSPPPAVKSVPQEKPAFQLDDGMEDDLKPDVAARREASMKAAAAVIEVDAARDNLATELLKEKEKRFRDYVQEVRVRANAEEIRRLLYNIHTRRNWASRPEED